MNSIDNSSNLSSEKILVLDFDGVIMDTVTLLDEWVKRICYRASNQYQIQINERFRDGEFDLETYRILLEEHFDYKDRVLEEVDKRFKGLIDYSKIICPEHFFPMVVSYINYLVRCGKYDKVYCVSHYNVDREVMEKAKMIETYLPGVIFVPVPFHKDKYQTGVKRKRTSKVKYMEEKYGINPSNTRYIDDSRSIIEECNKAGALGFNFNANSSDINTLHNLNPFNISVFEDASVIKLPEGRRR